VSELREWRRASEWAGEQDLVFPSLKGTPVIVENLRRRVLRPAAEEAGARRAPGFITSATPAGPCCSRAGRTPSRFRPKLGHQSPSFTVDTYVHLLRDGPGEPSRSLRSAMAPRSRPGSVTSRFWRGASRLTMRSGLRLRPARGGRRCRQHARTRSRSPARHRAPDAGCAVPLQGRAPPRSVGYEALSMPFAVTVVTGMPKPATFLGRSRCSQRDTRVGSVDTMISSNCSRFTASSTAARGS
jgi:hypothetical protein